MEPSGASRGRLEEEVVGDVEDDEGADEHDEDVEGANGFGVCREPGAAGVGVEEDGELVGLFGADVSDRQGRFCPLGQRAVFGVLDEDHVELAVGVLVSQAYVFVEQVLREGSSHGDFERPGAFDGDFEAFVARVHFSLVRRGYLREVSDDEAPVEGEICGGGEFEAFCVVEGGKDRDAFREVLDFFVFGELVDDADEFLLSVWELEDFVFEVEEACEDGLALEAQVVAGQRVLGCFELLEFAAVELGLELQLVLFFVAEALGVVRQRAIGVRRQEQLVRFEDANLGAQVRDVVQLHVGDSWIQRTSLAGFRVDAQDVLVFGLPGDWRAGLARARGLEADFSASVHGLGWLRGRR